MSPDSSKNMKKMSSRLFLNQSPSDILSNSKKNLFYKINKAPQLINVSKFKYNDTNNNEFGINHTIASLTNLSKQIK